MQLVDWSAVKDQADSSVLLPDGNPTDETFGSRSAHDAADTIHLSYKVPLQTLIVFESIVPIGTSIARSSSRFDIQEIDVPTQEELT